MDLSATIESHRHYIETVGSAIVLLFISGAILAVMCGGAYATSAEGFNGVSLAFLVGALVSLAALLLVLAAVVFALFGIRSRERYDLAPPAPQIVKVIEQAQPVTVTPPVLSSGVEIAPHMVGEWLDKDDLAWLCRYIALKKDWTARTLEGLPLPKSHLVITNKDGDETHPTTYARLMLLFTGSGLIVNRSDRKTGELTETDPDKMLEKILKRF